VLTSSHLEHVVVQGPGDAMYIAILPSSVFTFLLVVIIL
jgi:hypothetical protein